MSSEGSGGRRLAIAALLVSAATFALYLPSLENAFVSWDDYRHIHQNPLLSVSEPGDFKRLFTSFLEGNWFPLTLISYSVDFSIWGLDPRGFHLTNNILHALDALLATLLARGLFRRALGPSGDGGRTLLAALVVGAGFGLHPIHVESVAWASERKDVLYAFFWMLALLAYLRYAEGEGGAKKKVLYVVSLGAFVFSLMSKPMAITLPAVLLIIDYYPLGRLRSRASVLRVAVVEKLPFFALSGALSALTIYAQKTAGAVALSEYHSFGKGLLVGAKALWFYIAKVFFPAGLSPFYPLSRDISIARPLYAGSVALVLSAFAACFFLRRRAPVLWASFLYYFVTLLPVLGLVQAGAQGAADRYMYMPLLGPLVVSGAAFLWGIGRVGAKGRRLLAASALVVAVCLCALTVRQVQVWRDTRSLWGRVLDIYPESSWAYGGRGMAELEGGRAKEALSDFSKAVELEERSGPGSDKPSWLYYKSHWMYFGRGASYLDLGEYGRAVADFSRAIALMPSPPQEVYFIRRGDAYQGLGELEKAAEDYAKAISLRPEGVTAHNNLGSTYVRMGRYEDALKSFGRAIALAPGDGRLYFNRGRVYEMTGRLGEAASDFEAASRLGVGPARARLEGLSRKK